MIQRIQTVFLIIAAILLAFVAFMPFASIVGSGNDTIYELGLKGLINSANGQLVFNALPMAILIILCLALCVITIVLFKKRMIQIRLCVVNIVLLVGLEGLMFYYVRAAQSAVGEAISYSIVFIFPLAAAILIYLALRAIGRDEALVRSLDRLR